MYSSFKKPASSSLTTLKLELGSWMFAILSKFSKEQFLHLVKNMKTNPLLADFHKRVKNARITLGAINAQCTEKQSPFISKVFWYSIKFREGFQAEGEVEHPSHVKKENFVIFDVDATTQRQATVTDKIENSNAFGSFANAISDVLLDQNQSEKALTQISQEEAVLDAALKSQEVFFKQIEDDKQKKKDRALEILRDKERVLAELHQQQLELDVTISDVDEDSSEVAQAAKNGAKTKKRTKDDPKEAAIEAAVSALAQQAPQISIKKAEKAVREAHRKATHV